MKTKPATNDLLDVEEDTACQELSNKETKEHATQQISELLEFKEQKIEAQFKSIDGSETTHQQLLQVEQESQTYQKTEETETVMSPLRERQIMLESSAKELHEKLSRVREEIQQLSEEPSSIGYQTVSSPERNVTCIGQQADTPIPVQNSDE